MLNIFHALLRDVVYPLTYLSVKMTQCIRVRNVIFACVWPSGFVFAYLIFQNDSSSPSVVVDTTSTSSSFLFLIRRYVPCTHLPGKGWRCGRSNWYSFWLISFELQLQNKFNIVPKSHALSSNMTQTDKKRKPWYSCLRALSLDSWYLNVTYSVMTTITH